MKKTIFSYQGYKPYILDFLKNQPGKGRGFKSRMADSMKCQRSFVTKVFSRDSHLELSLEQAEKLNALLGHTDEEATFFLLLVQYSRAGTNGLRSHVREQMKQILNRRLEIKKEMESRNILSDEDHMRYYSAWYYAAIRVAVSVPSLQAPEALARKFKLPMATVKTTLDFLTSRGLIEKHGDRYTHCDRQQILLSSNHPMVNRHHVNWRIRALNSLEQEQAKDLHYSYVVTLSEDDALLLRSFLVESIQTFLKRAAPSPEETLYSFVLDYFEV